jgi:nicotinamidase-related amidase
MKSKPLKLNPGDPQKSVLLVIDVQREMFEQKTPIYQAELLLENILTLIDKAHAAHAPVIYIQHNAEDFLIKGSEGWHLHPKLDPQPDDWKIFKEHSSAFEEAELGELLTSLGVGRLVIVGLVTHGCVKNNCLGGLKVGYHVVLAGDAHSSYSKDAQALIDKWNTTLAAQGVVVMKTAEINFN